MSSRMLMTHEGQPNAKIDNVIDFGNGKMVLEHF